ncbi:hypothetical protein AB0873_16745 [Micromonospora sp. NPDC047707]|uniref:hypothetical protein n=1 Tax=unclassified Micromonospora TaxID=2617518 RepID=UPI0012B4AD26|nr:hypothetical protein [Micromonospora sp. WMMC415]QGN45897.1 hypothetical protein GKC29_02855 [Micromonospora sp. WMMC415]
MSTGDDGPADDVPRSSLRAAARDRRVWAILAVVAALLVCCCSGAVGTLLALSAGLFSGG